MAKKTAERPVLTVDPEFVALMPVQPADVLANLETRLLAEGCRDPLVAWEETGILLDGHTRRRLCEKHEIPYEVATVSLPDRCAAIDWIVGLANSRRNMTDVMWSYVRGQEFNAKKKAVGKPAAPAEGEPDSNGHAAPGSTASALADKYGVSERTITRDAKLAETIQSLPAKERIAVLRGEKAVPKNELVAKSVTTRPKKKPKPGRVKFPWGEFEKVFGRALRGVDEAAKSYETLQSNRHRSLVRKVKDLMQEIFGDKDTDGWRQELEKRQAEKE